MDRQQAIEVLTYVTDCYEGRHGNPKTAASAREALRVLSASPLPSLHPLLLKLIEAVDGFRRGKSTEWFGAHDAWRDAGRPLFAEGAPAASASPLPLSVVRPAVQRFALLMERELVENDHKGGWADDTPAELLRRLREEVAEVADRIKRRKAWDRENWPGVVASECADVANFAMMIADQAGGLPGGETVQERPMDVRPSAGEACPVQDARFGAHCVRPRLHDGACRFEEEAERCLAVSGPSESPLLGLHRDQCVLARHHKSQHDFDPTPTKETPREPPRCEVCDWPLADDVKRGCVPGNCSYRPDPGSEEYRRIQERRAALAAAAKGEPEMVRTGTCSCCRLTLPKDQMVDVGGRDGGHYYCRASFCDSTRRHFHGRIPSIDGDPPAAGAPTASPSPIQPCGLCGKECDTGGWFCKGCGPSPSSTAGETPEECAACGRTEREHDDTRSVCPGFEEAEAEAGEKAGDGEGRPCLHCNGTGERHSHLRGGIECAFCQGTGEDLAVDHAPRAPTASTPSTPGGSISPGVEERMDALVEAVDCLAFIVRDAERVPMDDVAAALERARRRT